MSHCHKHKQLWAKIPFFWLCHEWSVTEKKKQQQRDTSTVPIRNQTCDPHVHTSLSFTFNTVLSQKHGCIKTRSGFTACPGSLSHWLTRAGLCATAKVTVKELWKQSKPERTWWQPCCPWQLFLYIDFCFGRPIIFTLQSNSFAACLLLIVLFKSPLVCLSIKHSYTLAGWWYKRGFWFHASFSTDRNQVQWILS